MTETFNTKRFDIEGYYSHHCSATRPPRGRPIGGVSLLVSPRFKNARVLLSEDNTIIISTPFLNIIGMYSSGNTDDINDVVEKIGRAITLCPANVPTLLAGDLNCRLDQEVYSSRTTAVIDTLAAYGFWICTEPSIPTYYTDGGGPQNAPRRSGSSTIDIFAFSGRQEDVCYHGPVIGLVVTCFRKHVPVDISLVVNTERDTSSRRSGLGKRININKIRSALVAYHPDELNEMQPERLAQILTEELASASYRQLPNLRRSQPWFDSECYQLRSVVIQALVLSRDRPAMRSHYCRLRILYRRLLEEKKLQAAIRQEDQMVLQARSSPHLAIKGPPSFTSCPIPADTLRQHFESLFQTTDSIPDLPPLTHRPNEYWEQMLVEQTGRPFTVQEVKAVISDLKNNKAFGPDMIRNEHLKTAELLIPLWTSLFNKCLDSGTLPTIWTDCILKVIPKGKGNPLCTSSWRGIAKKSCVYKILSGLITRRLTIFLETRQVIPREQHGFRVGHSTTTAIAELLREVTTSLSQKRLPLYAVFVDYKSAFDTAPRNIGLEKLAANGVGQSILNLLTTFLRANPIILDDGVCEHEQFLQTTGYPQGDNISPLLFSVLLSDLPSLLTEHYPCVGIILYADDIVLYSRVFSELKGSIRLLEKYSRDNGLTINTSKTKAMKFRKAGPLRGSDRLTLCGSPIEFVSQFTYLGVVLTPSGSSFSEHLQYRVSRSREAMSLIPCPQKLSVKTAMLLFDMKVGSVAAYGILNIWPHLTATQLETLDKIKATFIKRVLGLPRNAQNRLTYCLGGCQPFIEDLVRRFALADTPALREFRQRFEMKMREVPEEFYLTPAMQSSSWKEPLQQHRRHILTRYSIHGFHHKLCRRRDFHNPNNDCLCLYCNRECSRYHHAVCSLAPSLNDLTREIL